MAKIVKTQEVEIGLEELTTIIKKNWNLLARCFSRHLVEEKVIKVNARLNLADIGNALRQTESLIVKADELAVAIIQVFREIKHQKPHFKNMSVARIPDLLPSLPISDLHISFDIDIAVAPVMPVDPLDIPGPDNPMDPDPTERFG